MKRSFLAKLHTNGIYYIVGALLLLIGVPLYQYLALLPLGYSDALTLAEGGTFAPYLSWIGTHFIAFLGYRVLSIMAFVALISLPFTLFRVIVAQEILGIEEVEQVENNTEESDEEDQPQQEEAQKREKPAGELLEKEAKDAYETAST